jgi:hypothetical protein
MPKVYISKYGDVEVFHSDDEMTPDVEPEEMKEWIRKKMKFIEGEVKDDSTDFSSFKSTEEYVHFDDLFYFFEKELGINNITMFSVKLEELENEGEIISSNKSKELIYLG